MLLSRSYFQFYLFFFSGPDFKSKPRFFFFSRLESFQSGNRRRLQNFEFALFVRKNSPDILYLGSKVQQFVKAFYYKFWIKTAVVLFPNLKP